MDGLPSSEVARRFGYSAGAFRVLCHDFRHHALPEFFAAPRPGRREQPMRGYDDAQARQIFRDLIDMPADVAITENEVRVRFHRRAHLPIVLASGLIDKPIAVPWWNGRRLRLVQ